MCCRNCSWGIWHPQPLSRGLLHMRPIQRWLHDRVPRWVWQHGMYRVSVTPSCHHTFSLWSDLAFPQAGVPLAQVSRHFFLCVNTGWGAICNGHAAAGLWTGPSSLKVFYCRISAGDCWSVKCVLSKNVKTCEYHSCFLTFLTGYLLTLGLHFT